MNAGQLRHRVTIQRDAGTTEDDAGQPVASWVDYVTAWAAIETSGRKFVAAQQVRSELTHIVTIRFHSALDIRKKLRIKWGSFYLYPLGPPVDIGNRRAWYEIQCAEEVRPA